MIPEDRVPLPKADHRNTFQLMSACFRSNAWQALAGARNGSRMTIDFGLSFKAAALPRAPGKLQYIIHIVVEALHIALEAL